jgi:ATP-dependent DNA helicase DinG
MIKVLEGREFDEIKESELVDSIFRNGGSLKEILDFDYREEQSVMASSVVKSLNDGSHLLFEAGTGVGKSLAYLIPSIIHAKRNSRPCVVATNTINLQEQLLEKDIPSVRKVFEAVDTLSEYADFRCALLVGRANYLCSTRLHRALSGQTDFLDVGQRKELERIANWANTEAVEGIRQEISPPPSVSVWEQINADSSICSSKRCHPEHCFYRRARNRVERANLVIVNHSLLFSLLGAGFGPDNEDGGVLFADDFIVFDEAHEIPEVASEHLGLSLSSWSLETFLRRLYNPRGRKGLLKSIGRLSDFEAVENAVLAVEDFFQILHVDTLGNKDRSRLVEKGRLPMEIFPPLSLVLRKLIELGETCEDETTKIEIKDQAKRMQGYLNGLSDIFDLKDPDSVYWMERTGKKNQIIHLRSAPLKIAEILREQLFAKKSSIVMTSATLTRKGKADTFKEEVGVDILDQKIVLSPFDYENNMQVRILSDCPEPQGKDRSLYLKFLVRAIDSAAKSIEGGTLALFTNFADLEYCFHNLKSSWGRLGRSVYAQGQGYSRSELGARMMEEGDVLLLGAESFWKGFDAKGPSLSQVILTRLPFENPGHPVMEAKTERLSKAGKSSFMEITIPRAVIRFRQGIGRLIRSHTDVGDLLIIDSRIISKRYGNHFLSELPKQNYDLVSILDLLGDIE